VPAIAVVAAGITATKALVLSQVVLSIALPLPMISLLIFTRRSDIMGAFANGRPTQLAAAIGAAVVLLLNVFLILVVCGVQLPGFAAAG
jgi:manganese transport protein